MSLKNKIKDSNKSLFSQIVDFIPDHIIQKSISSHRSDRYCKSYFTRDQLYATLFGQLNDCNTLRDITAGFNLNEQFIKDLGMTQSPARSTMGDGNKKRDWQVFEDIFTNLLTYYSRYFSRTEGYKVIKELQGKVIRIVDSSTISLCLSLFDWARFRTAKGAIKIHTVLDEETQLPCLINITQGAVHDKNFMDHISFEKDAILVFDKGYYDFATFNRLYDNHTFVTRIKSNSATIVDKENPIDPLYENTILSDQVVYYKSQKAKEKDIDNKPFRVVTVWDSEKLLKLHLLTNNMELPAHLIGELYKRRWKIELFFKALKQNFRVKTFLGTSENAVKSQLYIAIIAFVILEFLRRHVCKTKHAFKQFVNIIRICLMQYQCLNYVINDITPITKSIRIRPNNDIGQLSVNFTIQ